MDRKCFVSVSVRGTSSESVPRTSELGEFHAVWKNGVSIGSDPRCTVVLPELAPVSARVIAASNHKLLYRLPQSTSLPLPPVTFPVDRYDERIDYREFQLVRTGFVLARFTVTSEDWPTNASTGTPPTSAPVMRAVGAARASRRNHPHAVRHLS